MVSTRWILKISKSCSLSTKIKDSTKIYPEAPKVKITNSDPMVLEVGKASSLRATIEAGVPEPTITWKKKGSDEVLSTTNTLYFPNPTEAQQGVYVVEVCDLLPLVFFNNIL